ncbi:sialidase family protein [Helicobacter cholecystus]|uniref:sialidase family protein n=1 Tax=Helicobacter cholecystus TaxID=45498 RepID=UPI002738B03F|nr:sialidase family protein [Helicobacter cholecystus]
MDKKLFFFAVVLVFLGILFTHKPPTSPLFLLPPKEVTTSTSEYFYNSLPTLDHAQSVHSATLTSLKDGSLLAMWFAGSGEGKPDVQIYGSLYNPKTNIWSKPKSYLDRFKLKKDSKQFIKMLGNPVLFRSPKGEIHFFVVGVSFGGWATSKIYHYISNDEGKSFTYKQRLDLGILLNLSHLVRSQPIALEDGGFYLPIYHELADKYPLIVRFDEQGNVLEQIKTTSLAGQLQPSLIATSPTKCLAVFRNYNDGPMNMQYCFDGGKKWGKPFASNVMNEGNSIALFGIGEEIFLVHNTRERNPQESRGTLVLSKLLDHQWKQITILDVAQGKREKGKSIEVSYPTAISNGEWVDIIYTYNRSHIAHIRFNTQWLKEKQ